MMLRFKKIISIKDNIDLKNRNQLLDFIRGLSVLLVILHHCFLPIFGRIILLFHMPLFFLLSGITTKIINENFYNKSFNEYTKKRIKSLIIPYIYFELINLFIYALVTKGKVSFLTAFVSIITCINLDGYIGLCGRLWFLPCIFISNVLLYLILKKFHNKLSKIIILFLLLICSYISSKIIPFRLPFTIDISFLATFFVLLGYLLGDILHSFIYNSKLIIDIFITTVLLIICILLVIYFNPQMLMYINKYGNFVSSIVCSLLGSFIFIIICKYAYNLLSSIKSRFLMDMAIWLSQNSLATFPVHLQIKCVLLLINTIVFSKFVYLFPIVFLGNIIIVNIINQYLPFMVSKK